MINQTLQQKPLRAATRTKNLLLTIFVCGTISFQVDAQSSPSNAQNSAVLLKDAPVKSTVRLSGKFLSGTWYGKGADIINRGFKDSASDGYNYDIKLMLASGDEGGVLLEGSVSVVRKTGTGKGTFTRQFSGTGIRSSDILRINYQFNPEKDDSSDGVGIMIIQFSTTDNNGSGYYISRSPKSGALVNGKLTLQKQ
ncbi:hypothetical protein [Pollutibacter soli]|uniref:hypothetical protein n=1 Tax=Pollutibacter soli TaxID=3034157 RepID=UPI003013A751